MTDIDNILIKTSNLCDEGIIRQNLYQREIADMFKIVRIPPKLKSSFDPLQNQFHFNHFEYFQTLVLLFGIRLYVKKEDCKGLGVEFKKTTQLAAELISEFKPPEGA